MLGKVDASNTPDASEPAILSMLFRSPLIDYITTISGVVFHWFFSLLLRKHRLYVCFYF